MENLILYGALGLLTLLLIIALILLGTQRRRFTRDLEAQRDELLDALEQERDELDRATQAMDWFWQINEAYVRSRYSTARGLIEEMAAAGLTVDDLPAVSASDTGRFSPADRYQEIYDRLY